LRDRIPIELWVNGRTFQVEVEPRRLLADVLRKDLGFTGVHLGCEHGICGACTILLDGELVRSCLMFAVQAEGCQIVTVEGLSASGDLHPVQRAFIEEFGFQCGFCTPGMVLATWRLLEESPRPREEEIRRALAGNLCRCTGYADILRSVRRAAELLEQREVSHAP